MPKELPHKQQFKISLPAELAALIKFLGRGDPSQGMFTALDRLVVLDKSLLDEARRYLYQEQSWARIDADRAFEDARPLTEEEKRLKTIWDPLPENDLAAVAIKERKTKLASIKNTK